MKFWTRIEQFGKKNILRHTEGLWGRRVVFPNQVDWDRVKRILVVKQHDQLGDFLLSTPVLRALRERFPDAHLSLLVRRYVEPVARHNRHVDELLALEEVGTHWNWAKFRRFWKGLRSGFDLVVVLNTVSHSLTTDLLSWLAHAPYVLGPSHRLFAGTHRNFFYNLIAPYVEDGRHQSAQYLEIVAYIGATTQNLREEITILPEEQEWARWYLRKLGFDLAKPILGIHPGAGKIGNRWPAENFAQAASRLVQEFGLQPALFYGPKEGTLADRVEKEASVSLKRMDDLDLRELAAVFTQLDLFLGNDTGTTHVAAAVGTPLVVVFGPTDPRQWKPWGEEFVAVRSKDGRCDSVSVEEVLASAEILLRKKWGLPKNLRK